MWRRSHGHMNIRIDLTAAKSSADDTAPAPDRPQPSRTRGSTSTVNSDLRCDRNGPGMKRRALKTQGEWPVCAVQTMYRNDAIGAREGTDDEAEQHPISWRLTPLNNYLNSELIILMFESPERKWIWHWSVNQYECGKVNYDWFKRIIWQQSHNRNRPNPFQITKPQRNPIISTKKSWYSSLWIGNPNGEPRTVSLHDYVQKVIIPFSCILFLSLYFEYPHLIWRKCRLKACDDFNSYGMYR
jgi:hypothetical protein